MITACAGVACSGMNTAHVVTVIVAPLRRRFLIGCELRHNPDLPFRFRINRVRKGELRCQPIRQFLSRKCRRLGSRMRSLAPRLHWFCSRSLSCFRERSSREPGALLSMRHEKRGPVDPGPTPEAPPNCDKCGRPTTLLQSSVSGAFPVIGFFNASPAASSNGSLNRSPRIKMLAARCAIITSPNHRGAATR